MASRSLRMVACAAEVAFCRWRSSCISRALASRRLCVRACSCMKEACSRPAIASSCSDAAEAAAELAALRMASVST
eukprot:8815129-Pyramimonas_sp.AAC.1